VVEVAHDLLFRDAGAARFRLQIPRCGSVVTSDGSLSPRDTPLIAVARRQLFAMIFTAAASSETSV
jgi:hypothetical protein